MPAADILQSALVHHQAGRLQQAEALYRQILQTVPDHPDALHYLGVLAHQMGKSDSAVELISQAIRANPSDPMYYNNLGNVLKSVGKLDEALDNYQKVIQLKPDSAEAHYNLGNALRNQGRLDAAIESYRTAISLKPEFADAHSNLGLALKGQGKLDAAGECFRRALILRPDFAEAYYDLGNLLQEQGKFDQAVISYRKAISLTPDYAEAYCNLGSCLRSQSKLDEASTVLRHALSIDPGLADAHTNLAAIYADQGKFDDARGELSRALQSEPDHAVAWAALASLRKMTAEDDSWLSKALRLAPDAGLPAEKRIPLQFAIGKFYDDTGQYDLAFAAYRQANALARALHGKFDRAGFTRLLDGVIATCSADVVSRTQAGASSSRLPVLIVGMPRSGTSLVEQIIASHPDAYGAGELVFWNDWLTTNQAAFLSGRYGQALFAGAADEYQQVLRRHSADALRIVDKMPGNFVSAGLIHMIFPQAKIIHTQRHPWDTCLSIYFQNLAPAHSYATDLDDLAFYYREYARLMQHWRKVLPADSFLEVPYEALTDDQARWSRRMIAFIGLEWDERCLDFHKTERTVVTASNWQVRQKIYHTSRERWRNFEKYLGPLHNLKDLT